MRFACRYGSPHNAVKLVLPRTAWHSHFRPFSKSTFRLNSIPEPDDSVLLGAYTPRASPNPHAQNIAILGGGITGLATAYNLANEIPNAKITIYEAQDRLGGWIESEHVEVDGGKVLFEWGPRTLRPDLRGSGEATLQLLSKLSIRHDHIGELGFSRTSPAALNRYIYYPDHLVRMPGPSGSGTLAAIFGGLYTVLTEPIFNGVLPAVLSEPSIECRAPNTRDESVGDFISRRYGKAVADNLLSALFHGIYAGDIYKLSARTLLPMLWYFEGRDQDGNGINTEVLELFVRQQNLLSYNWVRYHNRYINDNGDERFYQTLQRRFAGMSIYTFVNGLQQLSTLLEKELRKNSNVTIQTSAPVQHLEFEKSNRKFTVSTKGNSESETMKYDYVVSSLGPGALHSILQEPTTKTTQSSTSTSASASPTSTPPDLLNALTHRPTSVNVMVVNLYYQNPTLPIPRGFGYLIPQSIPIDQNPERGLGVIFSSETAGPRGPSATQLAIQPWHLPNPTVTLETARKAWIDLAIRHKNMTSTEAQSRVDEAIPSTPQTIQIGQDTAPGTKLTVMLGGHWWSDWSPSDIPSPDDAIILAKSLLARHLKITDEPLLAKAKLQRNAIPQYQVGYRDDMARIHRAMVSAFDGRMKVAGTWWQGGVGLNDCVKKARETSTCIREGWDEHTGLEGWTENEKWILRDRRTGRSVWDPLMKGN